jgi:hypothetical protein
MNRTRKRATLHNAIVSAARAYIRYTGRDSASAPLAYSTLMHAVLDLERFIADSKPRSTRQSKLPGVL